MNSEEVPSPFESITKRKSICDAELTKAGFSATDNMQTQLILFNRIAAELRTRDLSKTATEKLLELWSELKQNIGQVIAVAPRRPQDSHECLFQEKFDNLPNFDWHLG